MSETTDNELTNMMDINVDQSSEQEITMTPSSETNVESENSNVLNVDDCVSVSDVILDNSDKYLKITVLNDTIRGISSDADVRNYIVYINTDKKIPCLYDCEKLIVPKTSVKNDDGTYKILSIEGRRSGFVIKCTGRDLIMSKNFIYDCELDANGKIVSAKEYNRKHTIENVTPSTVLTDFDSASLAVHAVLPKITKSGKYTTLEEIQQKVVESYNNVDDINALFKIVALRLQIGC